VIDAPGCRQKITLHNYADVAPIFSLLVREAKSALRAGQEGGLHWGGEGRGGEGASRWDEHMSCGASRKEIRGGTEERARARCQTPPVAGARDDEGRGGRGERCRRSGRSAERVADSARHDDGRMREGRGEPESHERSGLKVGRTSACPIAVVES